MKRKQMRWVNWISCKNFTFNAQIKTVQYFQEIENIITMSQITDFLPVVYVLFIFAQLLCKEKIFLKICFDIIRTINTFCMTDNSKEVENLLLSRGRHFFACYFDIGFRTPAQVHVMCPRLLWSVSQRERRKSFFLPSSHNWFNKVFVKEKLY